MARPKVRQFLPSLSNVLLALASSILLILAFPNFELWWAAWFALVPLLWAVEREKLSPSGSLLVGWIFGIVYFFGTCWWLTFAPITYAGFPPILAYFLLFCVTVVAGLFTGAFALIQSVFLRNFGATGMFAAPLVWVLSEFARYWVTGNNWNAIGYSQAFDGPARYMAQVGGVPLVGFAVVSASAFIGFLSVGRSQYLTGSRRSVGYVMLVTYLFRRFEQYDPEIAKARDAIDSEGGVPQLTAAKYVLGLIAIFVVAMAYTMAYQRGPLFPGRPVTDVVAIQPNVPMSGLNSTRWRELRQRHVELAEAALTGMDRSRPVTVIFPESPMNFQYDLDAEFRQWIKGFASRNNVSVIFNAAEPNPHENKYFNSAVMVDSSGAKIAQYDKIYLMPFGEAVPYPLQDIVPALVGSFSYGNEYDLLPIGEATAGVMICFESHFPDLSRQYVRDGADVIIELTNDGYLGQTPVLRQHLANAVFRAVETNRPVLRVTNVGITAYIDEHGRVVDPAGSYVEDTRVWQVARSDGKQTFYVRFGDWFAWLCAAVTFGLLGYLVYRHRRGVAKPASL